MAIELDKKYDSDNPVRTVRKPGTADLERVVAHFLNYLSNEPDKTGISPRCRFYGMLPTEAKLLHPDVSDDVILSCVTRMFRAIETQSDIMPRTNDGSWRSYS